MRNIIKIIAFTIIALSIGAITGCTDFPDEYAVDASVGEIRMKDDAKLSEDGKSYTATVLVDFDIKENTFNKISSALVYIDGAEYDVTGQLDPNTGGTAEIPCTFEVYRSVSVTATMNISTHSFENMAELFPMSFANDVKLSTGMADDITPCSAVLHVDANYPWLIENNNIYMLVSSAQFNMRVNDKVDNFNGQVLQCTLRTGYDYDSYNIDCSVKNLNANTSYFYQIVRLDSDSKVVYVGETKSFRTIEATAKINTSMDGLGMIYANVYAYLSPGNLSGLYTSDWKLVSYLGESPEDLQKYSVVNINRSPYNVYNMFSGLNASSKYYYRFDFYIGDGFMCSSGIKEFTTYESTASLTVSGSEIFDTYAKIGVTLDKGNTTTLFDLNKATVEICYGESKEQMLSKEQILVNNSKSLTFNLNDLHENMKYYYKVRFCLNGSVLASSDVLEFTTYKSADITNLGSLEIDTWNNDSSGKKQFNVNARKGSVLAFNYSINKGDHSLSAQLTGASNESLLQANASRTDWKSGSVYYVFTKTGTYTLTLSYTAHHYGEIKVPDIKFMY